MTPHSLARPPGGVAVPLVDQTALGADPEDPSSCFFARPTGAEHFRALHAAACGDKKQTIRGVPVDLRESSDSAFQAMIQRTNHEERYAQLCNTGGRGTGETVLQLRDCLRFVSNRSHARTGKSLGFRTGSVPTTRSGTPCFATRAGTARTKKRCSRATACGSSPIAAMRELEKSGVSQRQFAAGIFARIYDRVKCTPPTGRCANPTDNNYDFEQLAERLELSPNAVMSPSNLIVAALKDIKARLGRDPLCPVLLAVDDLVRAAQSSPGLGTEPETFLCSLSAATEATGEEGGWLYLSVSVNAAATLRTFAFRRPLLIEPMPPIVPFASSAPAPEALPAFLRPFAVEAELLKLPFTNEALSAYAASTQWLLSTGGHPRKVQELFTTMTQRWSAAGQRSDETGPSEGSQFDTTMNRRSTADSTSEGSWSENRLTNCLPFAGWNFSVSTINFANGWRELLDEFPDESPSTERRQELFRCIVRDCSQGFEFPRDGKSAKKHEALLEGSRLGVLSFLPAAREYGTGRMFVPLPVLLEIGKYDAHGESDVKEGLPHDELIQAIADRESEWSTLQAALCHVGLALTRFSQFERNRRAGPWLSSARRQNGRSISRCARVDCSQRCGTVRISCCQGFTV